MRSYDVTFPSANNILFPKPTTALVIEPERITPETGVMLFTHGWGSNRYAPQDRMEWSCETYNLVCISVEYRQSGYDFDPVKGTGAAIPYDASFLQVFDVLNGLRTVLNMHPELSRRRISHYGTSQGGHIALLSAVFAPHTFAFIYPSSPLTHMDEERRAWVGREFAAYELSIRNVLEHADRIRCPVFLEVGTADEILPWESHAKTLVERLTSLGKTVTTEYYEGGDHQLQPTTTKLDAFKKMAAEPMRTLTSDGNDDFAVASTIDIPCADRVLRIDWSKPPADANLISWI